MGRPRYTNAAAAYPIFALSTQELAAGDGQETRTCIVNVGGGGSARSGISNSVAVFSVKKNDQDIPIVETEVVYSTGEKLATSCEASKDGKWVATSVSEGCLVLKYDGKKRTLEKACFFETDKVIDENTPAGQNIVRFSPADSSILATGGDDHSATIWKLEPLETGDVTSSEEEKGVELQKSKQEGTEEEEEEEEKSATKKEDEKEKEKEGEKEEKKKATDDDTKSADKEKETVKATQLHRLTGHTKAIKDLDFHPDGKYLVTACADNTCRIWNIESGKVVQILPSDTAAQMSYRRCRFVNSDRLLTLQAKQGRGSYSFLVEFVRDSSSSEANQWRLTRSAKVYKGLATNIHIQPPFISVGDAAGGVSLVDLETLEVLKHHPEAHSLPITGLSSIPIPNDPEGTYILTASMDKTITMIPAVRPKFRGLTKLLLPLLLILLVLLARLTLFGEDSDAETGEPKEL